MADFDLDIMEKENTAAMKVEILIEEQGWNDVTMLQLHNMFLSEKLYFTDFLKFLRDLPEVENEPTRRVEFILARENKTWDTCVLDVPAELDDDNDDAAILEWFHDKHMETARFRDVVHVGIYLLCPTEDTDNPA